MSRADVWVDGEFDDSRTALFGVRDPAVTHGLGLFETMGGFGGQLPLLGRHMERLRSSADALGLAIAHDDDTISSAGQELLRRNDDKDGVLRLTLGAATEGGTRCVLSTRARAGSDDAVRLAVSRCRRGDGDLTARHKTTSRVFYELAMRTVEMDPTAWFRLGGDRVAGVSPVGESGAEGVAFDDCIILGRDDEVLETSVGNLWMLHGDGLVTPALDGRALPGVGRAALLDALPEVEGAPRVVERTLTLEDAVAAQCLWVTNAVYGPRRARLLGARAPAQSELQDIAMCDTGLRAAWRHVVGQG